MVVTLTHARKSHDPTRPEIRQGYLEDKQVPYVVEKLRRLGIVRDVQTHGPGLTQLGISELRSGLPGIDVVPSANPALHRYFRDQVEHEHSGAEGLKLAAVLAAGLLGILIFFAWPLVRHRRRKSVHAT